MRDTNRLDSFYRKLYELHKKYVPDWRFGQFVSNYANDTGRDIFFDEENTTLRLIEEWLKKICKEPKIVRSYYKVMVETEYSHNSIDCEWDGIEYESIDEAKKVAKKAEENPKVYNAWVRTISVDENGNEFIPISAPRFPQ